MRRKTVGDRLVDVPDLVFACDFSDDPDPLARACAPEQPEKVAVGQKWLRLADGAELPVKRVGPKCRSRGLRVDLGGQSLTVVLYEHELRKEWVCMDAPDNVTELAP
jgi:hypothetical protein